MTDHRLPGGGVGEDDDRVDDGRDISAADQQALTDLFASLVAEASAAQISPLEIIKLGRIDRRTALDAKIKRFKVLRNVLVAAAFAALVVLIVPHLGASSSESAAVSGSSSSPALRAAAAAPSAAAASAEKYLAGGGSVAGSVASTGSAAAAGSVGAGTVASGAMSSAAASPGTGGGAVRPDAASTSGDNSKTSSPAVAPSAASAPSASGAPSVAGVRCPPLSAGVLAAVRSAFPAGYLGAAKATTGCAGSGSNRPVAGSLLTATADPGATLVVTVGRAGAGACVPDGCVRRAGTNAYAAPAGSSVWVYGNGFQVLLETRGTFVRPPTVDQLVDAGRAALRTLG